MSIYLVSTDCQGSTGDLKRVTLKLTSLGATSFLLLFLMTSSTSVVASRNIKCFRLSIPRVQLGGSLRVGIRKFETQLAFIASIYFC